MKPKDQWGPADELASGVLLAINIIGNLIYLVLLFIGYLWLLAWLWPNAQNWPFIALLGSFLATVAIIFGIAVVLTALLSKNTPG